MNVEAMLTGRDACQSSNAYTNMTSWKITYFSIGDTSDSFMAIFCHYVRFRGYKHSSDGKKNILQTWFWSWSHFFSSTSPINDWLLAQKKHMLSFVGTEPPYFGIRVDETRAAGNNTSKRSGKNTVSWGGNRSYSAMRGLPTDNIYIYLYMVAPKKKLYRYVLYRTSGIYMCILQNIFPSLRGGIFSDNW